MPLDPMSFGENKETFAAFLDSAAGETYDTRVKEMARGADGRKSQRLLVNVNDVRRFDVGLATRLLAQPLDFLAPWQEVVLERLRGQVADEGSASKEAAKRQARLARAGGGVALAARTHLGFVGAFGSQHVSPRELRASQLGVMVCVEGVVTKCSLSQPKVVRSVHWCANTASYTAREYRDSTALDLGVVTASRSTGGDAEEQGAPRVPQGSGAYPTKDAEGNPLETEFGLGVYKDHQCITVQEPPERAPLGQLPRSIDVFLDDDLVDTVKPGDRVRCAGVYRALTHGGATSSGNFRTVVLANSLATRGRDDVAVALTKRDVASVESIGKRLERCSQAPASKDAMPTGFGCALRALGAAFAPSIYGHDAIKRALVLQLVGGSEKLLKSGGRLRGDINVLLVGDPSTAKSQLLRATMRAAPLSVSTTGRGSSGVGLTAAIAHDPETGDRRLEAGAVVLADRGIVCIDEFDKMSTGDRVAIHEVMEQQTVTLAKAGIHASLNARCSVLAAANPVYGQYDAERRPQENIGLPDSLLSRFDLLFIVLDNVEQDTDRKVAEHVLANHRYRRPGADMTPEPLDADAFLGHRAFDSFRGAHAANEADARLADSRVDASIEDDGSSPVWRSAAAQLAVEKEFEDEESAALKKKKRRRSSNAAEDEEVECALPHKEVLLHPDFVRKYVHYARHHVQPALTDDARESVAAAYADLRAKQDDRSLPVTARCLESLIRIATAHAKVRLSAHVDCRDCAHALQLVSFALYGDSQRQDADDDDDEEAHVSSKQHDEDQGEDEELVTQPAGRPQRASAKRAKAVTVPPKRGKFITGTVQSIHAQLAQRDEADEEFPVAKILEQLESALPPDWAAFDLAEVEAVLKELANENKLMYNDFSGMVSFV